MGRFVTWHYWFNMFPEPISGRSQIIVLILAIILAIGGVILQLLVKKQTKRIWRRWLADAAWFAFTNAFVLACLDLFNWQIIPYLDARWLFLAWLIIGLIWFIRLVYRCFKLKAKNPQAEEQKIKSKYLPK